MQINMICMVLHSYFWLTEKLAEGYFDPFKTFRRRNFFKNIKCNALTFWLFILYFNVKKILLLRWVFRNWVIKIFNEKSKLLQLVLMLIRTCQMCTNIFLLYKNNQNKGVQSCYRPDYILYLMWVQDALKINILWRMSHWRQYTDCAIFLCKT